MGYGMRGCGRVVGYGVGGRGFSFFPGSIRGWVVVSRIQARVRGGERHGRVVYWGVRKGLGATTVVLCVSGDMGRSREGEQCQCEVCGHSTGCTYL